MINKRMRELLKEYKENNPDMSISDMSNVEHLVMRNLLERQYFEGMTVDMYINDLENVTFHNGISSVNTMPKEDFGNTGGYVLTRSHVERLEEIQDIFTEAKSLNDLVGKFNEDDALLIHQFSVALPKDEFFSLLCMVKFRENINKDANYQISYEDYYAKTLLLVAIEQGCSLDNDFKYSFGSNDVIKRHLTNNVNVITQDLLSTSVLKGMVRAENKTLAAICDKKLIANPDIENSDHKTIYGDLSAIYNNPLIKENTMMGIIFDDQLSGPEKLMKIYERKYFNVVKGKFINTIDFQLNKPTIEDLNERYANIVNPIIEKLDNDFPVLNTVRSDNVYYTKSEFDFNSFYESSKDKNWVTSRDLLGADQSLINSTMDGYFSRTLEPVDIKLVDRQPSTSFRMTTTNIENYHNNIESLLLIKTRTFSERDLPHLEKPNFIVLDKISFPQELTHKSFEILRDYVQEKQKAGINIIINAQDFSHYNTKYKDELLKLAIYSNVIVSDMESFEVKMSRILESLDQYDKTNRVLTSTEKDYLVVTALDKMNAEFSNSVSPYSSASGARAKEFMDKLIVEEVTSGFKHKRTIIKNKPDVDWSTI
jgi:hypothetical protein